MLAPRTAADGAVPGPPPASALATKASAASAPSVRPAAPIATLERLQYSQSIWLPLATARHVLAGRRADIARRGRPRLRRRGRSRRRLADGDDRGDAGAAGRPLPARSRDAVAEMAGGGLPA